MTVEIVSATRAELRLATEYQDLTWAFAEFKRRWPDASCTLLRTEWRDGTGRVVDWSTDGEDVRVAWVFEAPVDPYELVSYELSTGYAIRVRLQDGDPGYVDIMGDDGTTVAHLMSMSRLDFRAMSRHFGAV